MPSEQDTGNTPETAPEQVNGSQQGSIPATPSEPVQEPQQVTQEPKTNAELEALRKERDQALMRANQLENERKDSERKRLEEENRYKELYEQEQAARREREERETREQALVEAKKLRDSAIDSYPDENVRKAAKALTSKNDNYFFWNENVGSEVEAIADVKAQLDAFAEAAGLRSEPKPAPVIDANNPIEGRDSTTKEDLEAEKKRLANFTF